MIEIDGIQRAFESPITESGDYISDTYFRAIEIATAPTIWRRDEVELASSVRRLNRNHGTVANYLGHAGLIDVYNDVIGQLNEINLWSTEVGQLQIITEADASKSSPRFAFAN
ncbi:hypothetical protein KBD20_00660 [Candidatus Saccharibacteria bacterium]|nr:hypothetical protein [Candidatus Saccharibacteria bacterium]